MRSVGRAILAAMLFHGAAAAAPVAVEADRVECASLAGESGHSTQLLLAGSLAMARSAWIVRDPKVRPDPDGVAWCPQMFAQDVVPATCRRDGPPLVAGALEVTVTEALIGGMTEAVHIRMPAAARAAFTDDFRGAESGCERGVRVEQIKGEGFFSPDLTALDPRREFLFLLTPDEAGKAAVLAFALPERSGPTKRALRRAARERATLAE